MGIIGISTPPFYIYCLIMTSIEELQSAQMFFAGKYDERRVKHGGKLLLYFKLRTEVCPRVRVPVTEGYI